jgi:hypothetical protein
VSAASAHCCVTEFDYRRFVSNESRGGTVLSSKNKINMNHYKTRGRKRQGEGVVHDDHTHSFAQVVASSGERVMNPFRRFDVAKISRLKRLRKIRGLTARQLMERKRSQRASSKTKPGLVTTAVREPRFANQTTDCEASC